MGCVTEDREFAPSSKKPNSLRESESIQRACDGLSHEQCKRKAIAETWLTINQER